MYIGNVARKTTPLQIESNGFSQFVPRSHISSPVSLSVCSQTLCWVVNSWTRKWSISIGCFDNRKLHENLQSCLDLFQFVQLSFHVFELNINYLLIDLPWQRKTFTLKGHTKPKKSKNKVDVKFLFGVFNTRNIWSKQDWQKVMKFCRQGVWTKRNNDDDTVVFWIF